MSRGASSLLSEYLAALFGSKPARVSSLLEQAVVEKAPEARCMLRLAVQRPAPTALHWLKLLNVWTRLERPMLKPNPVAKRVLLLTDFTAEGLVPSIDLVAAAFGVRTEIDLPPFDSVEQTILSGKWGEPPPDVIVLVLSDEWLRRQWGPSALVPRERVAAAEQRLAELVSTIRAESGADILVANFPPPPYASPLGAVRAGDFLGWNVAVGRLNSTLSDTSVPRTHVVDVADALFGAGGRAALGRTSFLRARMAYEPQGNLAVARTLASAIAALAGKSHRALLTDWDNTLWGGEIAEAGASGIVYGPETPDGLAYSRVQERIKELRAAGVLLGALSRNDPGIVDVVRRTPNLGVTLDDFATVQVALQPKSAGVDRAAQELGFGPEFMVLVEDSLFEIAEVVGAHSDIDVVLAGPDPQSTLERLGDAPFFAALRLGAEDLGRSGQAGALRQQREHSASFSSLGAFLDDIRIRLYASTLSPENVDRVVQLLQKSNQFNLTSRRHGHAQLEELTRRGASTFAYRYEDAFGSQGIISVVVLIPEADALRIDSWVMSCRVLNRTVESAVFAHVLAQAAERRVVGEFIPTDRNGLVARHYETLGFRRLETDATDKTELWSYERGREEPPSHHHVTLIEE